MSSKPIEELKDDRATYQMVLSSPELLIQLSGARNMSLLETMRDVRERIKELEVEIHKQELKAMNPGL